MAFGAVGLAIDDAVDNTKIARRDAMMTTLIGSLRRFADQFGWEFGSDFSLVLRSKRMIHGRPAQYRRPGRPYADELNHLTGSEH